MVVTGFKDTFFYTKKTSAARGRLLDWSEPRIMGILNVTPDSFYDGNPQHTLEGSIQKARQMVSDGADLLDIGGYSTRPGAADISAEEELNRVLPVIRQLSRELPHIPLSIDTFRSDVAAAAVEAGACIINDVSGGTADPGMFGVAAACGVPYILMHIRGTPQTMAQQTTYDDLIPDLLAYFTQRTTLARQAGIRDIIIDPGFGFAKQAGQNYTLLNRLDVFRLFGLPILAGVSRKSMIYRTLDTTADGALNGTTVLHTVALMKGAQILRVHDVKEAKEVVTLMKKMKEMNE